MQYVYIITQFYPLFKTLLAMTESLVRSGSLSALVFDADALDFLWTDPEATSRLAAFLDRLPPPGPLTYRLPLPARIAHRPLPGQFSAGAAGGAALPGHHVQYHPLAVATDGRVLHL